MPGTSVLRALLTFGATLRLTRLVTVDDLGQWWLKDPIDDAAERWYVRQQKRAALALDGHTANFEEMPVDQPWWWKYRSGLDCPHCFSFWTALLVVVLTSLTRGTPLSRPWRGLMGALALNYVAAHTESLLTAATAADDQETDR